jgi:valyl-tRNA synthetase
MSEQLSKAYEPTTVETQALKAWNETHAFHAEPTDPGAPYSIVIPPPNVTAALHLGHALNNTLQDILTRYHRMLGDNTCWLPGTDHAGIATQTVVEKRVLKEQGKRRTDFQRDEFIKLIQAWKDEYEATITGQLKAMGCSCDWDRQAFTMDEPRARAVREAFFQLFKDGLIYRGKRLVNWDPATQTALADDEVEMEEIDGHFYYLQYPLEDGSGHVTVATTRPETMLGDTAVAINPKDPRAASLRGKKVRLPIVDRIIPVIEDEYVVLADPNSDDAKARYASGFLKVTPAHDPNDYELGRKHNLPLINVMAPDGSISDKHGWTDIGDAGFVLGLDRYEARKAIVEWFRQNNLLEDVKPYRHSVGHSYRSHVPIEPYLSDQWYCKVTDDRLAGAALRAMAPDQREDRRSERGMGAPPVPSESDARGRGAHATEELRFFPARYAKTFQTWHENIRDWCISRQLWWGHRIPVWSAEFTGDDADAASNRMREIIGKNGAGDGIGGFDVKHFGDRLYVCLKDPEGAQAKLVDIIEMQGFRRDPDVLDTWFSSGLWPLSTLGWPDDTPELNKWNPTNVLVTAREIITLWVSRMVMFNLYFRKRLPFIEVYINPVVQDGEGRKMSKSLGNGVDPLDIIHTHGADAMRFTLATMATNTQDVRMPVEKDAKTGKNTSPKFDIGRNFCNKMWNATRFLFMNLESVPVAAVDEAQWTITDRWILSRLARTVKTVEDAMANYRFDVYSKACYDFFWGDLCDWYIEAIKPQMRDEQRAPHVANVLATCLDVSLRLMHPMIPFITEILWWKLNEVRPQRGIPNRITPGDNAQLIRARWPKYDERMEGITSEGAEHVFTRLQEVITEIRKVRNDHNVSPKQTVTVSIQGPEESIRQIEANKVLIEHLALCKVKEAASRLSGIASNAAKSQAAGCELFIEGAVDEKAEAERSVKRRDELTKQIAAMKGRLANAGYIAKAPPHLVKQTQDQLAEAEAELAKLG